jgi:hypothetical protein
MKNAYLEEILETFIFSVRMDVMILISPSLRPSSYIAHLLQGLSSCLFPTCKSLHAFLIISHVERYIDSCPEQRVEELRRDIGGSGARLSAGTVIYVFSGFFLGLRRPEPKTDI